MLDLQKWLDDNAKIWGITHASFAVHRNGITENYVVNNTDSVVDSKTIYPIGSITKSFTSVLVNKLLKAKGLNWESNVTEIMHSLSSMEQRLNHNKITVTDFATHRTGLARHDFAWVLQYSARYIYSKEMLLKHAQFLDPNSTFRNKWNYNNYCYALLGYIAEELEDNKPYEMLLNEQVLRYIGLDKSVTITDDDCLAKNVEKGERAQLYRQLERHTESHTERQKVPTKADFAPIGGMMPAGGIWCSANDLAEWGKVWLGKYYDVLDQEDIDFLTTPVIATGRKSGILGNSATETYARGGLFVNTLHNRKVIYHAGGVLGGCAFLAVMPDIDCTVSSLIALDNGMSGFAIAFTDAVLSSELGLEPYRTSKQLFDAMFDEQGKKREIDGSVNSGSKLNGTRLNDAELRQFCEMYCGKYRHVLYGDVEIGNYGVHWNGALLGVYGIDGDHSKVVNFEISGLEYAIVEVKISGGILSMKLEEGLEPYVFRHITS